MSKRYSSVIFSKADANVIGPVLERLASQHKSSISGIVAEASKKTSPLHPYFEWDDVAAADKYRIEQAERMARHILVSVETPDGQERTMRAFLPVYIDVAGKRSRSRHYLPIDLIQKDADYASQALIEARRQLRAWLNRYREYEAAFGDLFPILEQALTEDVEADLAA